MIDCIGIDDEPLALEVLKKYILKTPELNLLHVFTDPLKAKAYLQKNAVGLIFLDIKMPGLNGLELYESLTVKPMVIFATAHKEHAVQAFELNAIDYLLKPFNFTRFHQAVQKATIREKFEEKEILQDKHLYIYCDYKMVKIEFGEIVFIEALDDHVKINTVTQSYLTVSSMKKIIEKLPLNTFLRVHRSYIVAKEKIVLMQYRTIKLIDNIELPVGDTYRAAISALKKKMQLNNLPPHHTK